MPRIFDSKIASCLRLIGLAGIFCLLVSACGFHLRGAQISSKYSAVMVRGGNPYGELVPELRRALRGVGVQVVESPEQAQAIINIQREAVDRQVLAVGSTGKVREYGLSLNIDFEVTAPKGQVLLPRQTVYTTRDYSFDPTKVLGMADEETQLRQEMIRDAAQQMLWRLRAK